jgi:RNA polymerase sigma-70 factor (ECF subfamily)
LRVIDTKGGDPVQARFEDLLQRYEKEIFRFACRMTGNREDGADVLQETFLRAFKAFPKLPRDANHRAWLYRIASRLALNLARAQRVRRAVPIDEAIELPEPDGDLESLVETKRLARVLVKVVRNLSSRQRIALLQRKYEGLPYREVALTLGCTEEAARAHVYQAMGKIRRSLVASNEQKNEPTAGRS